MTEFTWHLDASHEWLEVDWSCLKRVGLNPWDFSRYSYRNGNTFYLEGDCDAARFLHAWEKEGDVTFKDVDDGLVSFIRALPHLETSKP